MNLIKNFLSELKQNKDLAPTSIKAIEQDLKILNYLVDEKDIRKLQAADIRSFIAKEHRRGISPTSIKRLLSSWRKFFNSLNEKLIMENNPIVGIRAPRSGKKLVKALNPDETNNFFQSINQDNNISMRDLAMFETAYSSALRVSELIALNCEDIDYDARTINIKQGKGNKQRIVPIGTKAINALQQWLRKRQEININNIGALFTNLKGKRLTVRTVQQRIKIYAQKAGIAGDITPHMLRHSCASHILQSSNDLRGVQEILGHADISSTQVYTHLNFQALAKVYDKAHPHAKKVNNESK